MAIKLPANVKWRDGRPRWEPGPTIRAKGWRGRDLKDSDGEWLGLEAAMAAAAALNNDVRGADGGTAPARQRTRPEVRTVAMLWSRYVQSPAFRQLAPRTAADYANKSKPFLQAFGEAPLAAVEPHHVYSWWERLHAERGHAMANGVLAVARACLSHARRIGWRSDNPARQLGIETVAPRVVVWTPAECRHLVATADAMGHLSIGDAIVLALNTGQRQADLLALQFERIADGRVVFRQAKTGARVRVPHTDQLAARLDTIRQRRTGQSVVRLASEVVRAEKTGVMWPSNRFQKVFRTVRDCASADMPAIADKLFMDLRDTAVTRLALAGCTVPEIRSITGHTLQSVHQVLEHYLALDDAQAESAIDKLKSWMEQQNIAV